MPSTAPPAVLIPFVPPRKPSQAANLALSKWWQVPHPAGSVLGLTSCLGMASLTSAVATGVGGTGVPGQPRAPVAAAASAAASAGGGGDAQLPSAVASMPSSPVVGGRSLASLPRPLSIPGSLMMYGAADVASVGPGFEGPRLAWHSLHTPPTVRGGARDHTRPGRHRLHAPQDPAAAVGWWASCTNPS